MDGDDRNGWHPILDGSHALDASFPAGAAEPAQLVGDDDATDALATWAPSTAAALSGVDNGYPYRSLDDPVAAAPPRPALPGAMQLTIDDKKAIVLKVAQAESGAAAYSAINPDGEFNGAFNRNGYVHPASQTYHVGLSYGLIQFTQDGGSLGQLLAMMRDRDAATFAATFGPDSDESSASPTPGPGSKDCPGGRSARVQPIGGADLWEQPWRDRFTAAGQVVAFQAAQLELAATAYLDPMLEFCGNLGFDTDRSLAIAYDRSVQMGPLAARVWIANAAGRSRRTHSASRRSARSASPTSARSSRRTGRRPTGSGGR